MPRHDPARLSLEHYPCIAEVGTRYADLDPQAHINNVAVAAIYEEGRSQFLRWLTANAETELEPPRRLIAEVRIRYLAQIYYPSQLCVAAGILGIGQRSYRIGQAIFQNGQCAGLCDTVIVHSDGQSAVDITSAWRHALEQSAVRA